MISVSRLLRFGEGGRIGFRCPACQEAHFIHTGEGPGPRWYYNGNPDSPTFRDSVKVDYGDGKICHSQVTDGIISYYGDCTQHDKSGQTLPLDRWKLEWW